MKDSNDQVENKDRQKKKKQNPKNKNKKKEKDLDEELKDTFPASDTPSSTQPGQSKNKK